MGLLGSCTVANTILFLTLPFYCSYRSVRHFEAEMNSVRAALPLAGTPDKILLVGFDSHFLGYRHAGYYLPGYVTLQYPEVQLLEGARIFTMHGGDTALLSGLPAGGYTRFVLCPLPAGDHESEQYLPNVLKLLPPQDLTTVEAGGQKLLSAPIADLPLLFPHAATMQRQDVYALLHSPPGL